MYTKRNKKREKEGKESIIIPLSKRALTPGGLFCDKKGEKEK
jgi:hypothetical protein